MNADGPQMTGFADNDSDTGAHDAVPGWGGILDPGKRIVWQGRPDRGFHVAASEIPGALFALMFSGFAVFRVTRAAEAGGVFRTFGLIHFPVGLGPFWKPLFGATRRRRQTWDTRTGRRTFIATKSARKGKALKSDPITPAIPIICKDGPLATIHSARERRTDNKRRSRTVPKGFERMTDGEGVLARLRATQRKEATP